MEWAGAFGDLGTLIPFVVAYIAVVKVGPFGILLSFGVAIVVCGLALLPHDTESACRLARCRSAWMKGRVRLGIDAKRELRHAIEIRHESFLDPSFIKLLRAHRVALVIAETAGQWPLFEDLTADFVYVRLHGDQDLYRNGYDDDALTRWAQRIRTWGAGREPADVRKIDDTKSPVTRARDVYCFFDNTDAKSRAPFDAQTLMQKLRLRPTRRSEDGNSPVGYLRRKAHAEAPPV